jgi:hypothetical protein
LFLTLAVLVGIVFYSIADSWSQEVIALLGSLVATAVLVAYDLKGTDFRAMLTLEIRPKNEVAGLQAEEPNNGSAGERAGALLSLSIEAVVVVIGSVLMLFWLIAVVGVLMTVAYAASRRKNGLRRAMAFLSFFVAAYGAIGTTVQFLSG